MIDETKTVDLLAISDQSREVFFIVTDYLPWDEDEFGHLHLLQEKLNYYLGILESDELCEKFPKTRNYKIINEVDGLYPLSKDAQEFYEKAKSAIKGFGFELTFRLSRSARN